MFHTISPAMLNRMKFLEELDASDRLDNTPRMQRLRQIPPETGKFLALLAASSPKGTMIEIGTSAGYSTLWLSLACEQSKLQITTFEILSEKVKLARETFREAGVEKTVQLIEGDAREYFSQFRDVALCFLDAEKEVYADCYEAIIPKLVPGGLLVADNAISHQATLQPLLDRALADERVDALIVPIGNGELVCRKI
jgi:caffeoyl-CoA O-methyltransferase